MMSDLILLLKLYWEFFKTGLFSVGGGLATLPFLSDMADKTGWFTRSDLANMIAVAESTPGPVGVNTATYVGYSTAGIPGALISTIGLVTPSVIIILIIATVLNKFKENRFIISIFNYLRPASAGLITSAFISLSVMTFFFQSQENSSYTITDLNYAAVILAIILFILTNYVKKLNKIHPIAWIGLSAVIGIFIL